MDAYEAGKSAGVAARYATDLMVAKIRAGQEPAAAAWEQAANAILNWMNAKAQENTTPTVPPTQAAPPQVPQSPGPFGAPQPQQNVAPQPAAASQPVVQPSQPQQVVSGPACPNCGTPMVQTKDYVAKKARNLSEGKKAPPLWRCPLGSWTPQTGAQGCQGCQFEEAA